MARKKVETPTSDLDEMEIGRLAWIVEQNDSGAYAMAAEDYSQSLVDKGYVEVNVAMATDAGDVPTRPTEKGIKFIKDNSVTETATAPVETTTASFGVDDNIPVPAAKRGGGGGRKGPRGSKYPFDTMENGQSFFVPATAEMENPAKTLASTASTFKKKYGTQTGTRSITRKGVTKDVPAYTFTRGFVVRAVTENGVAGCRVWRDDTTANAAVSE